MDLNKKGLTIIEILIVLTIISILFGVFLYIWNALDIFKKSRDARRMNDLQLIDTALKTLLSTNSEISLGRENIIYTSLPDSSSTCGSYNLVKIYSPFSYNCVSSPSKIDGTGWIPVNFNLNKFLGLSILPVDPLNNADFFYAYQVQGRRYKLAAKFETQALINKMASDGGFEPTLYEVGSDLRIPSPHSGLVGYWSFDEGSGTMAYDLSGYGNNGTLVNGPIWVNGKVGKALSFDGVNDHVERTFASIMRQLPLTLSAWVKPRLRTDGTDFPNNIISNDRPGYFGHGFGVNVWSNGSQMKIEYENGFRVIPGVSFAEDQWNNIFIVYTSGNVKSYLNGILVDNFSYAQANLDAGDYVFIGKHNNDTGYGTRRFFNGLIDEVRIYNRALSDAEIKALYDATK